MMKKNMTKNYKYDEEVGQEEEEVGQEKEEVGQEEEEEVGQEEEEVGQEEEHDESNEHIPLRCSTFFGYNF